MTKHGRLQGLFNRRIKKIAIRNVPVKTAQATDMPRQIIRPGVDTEAESRYFVPALYNSAVNAFDRLILERCYTFEGLCEVIETWRKHGMRERQIWIQLWVLYSRKKSMKFEPRLQTDPRDELLKYYDPKMVDRIFYEINRCEESWKKRDKRREQAAVSARLSTGSAMPGATSTTQSRPSTAA